MNSTLSLRMRSYLLAAGLAFGAATALAANGVTVTESQETMVEVGMSMAEVEENLGRPDNIGKYPNASGPTWTYEVVRAPFGMTEFDVNFGSDGNVASVDERVIGDK